MNENVMNFNYNGDNPLDSTGVPRKNLVVFFLIDTSASMKGKKMGELNTIMEELIPEISHIGGADTDIKIAVLTFSDDIQWMYSIPMSAESFEWNRLNASGVTNMGKAFEELASKLSMSSFLDNPSMSLAPVIFLMTDGFPSDEYKKGLAMLKSNSWFNYAVKTALGMGEDADDKMLAEFTGSPDTVVHAYTGNQLAKLIKTVAVTASQIGSETYSDGINGISGKSKQELLGEQLQKLTAEEDDDFTFSTGW